MYYKLYSYHCRNVEYKKKVLYNSTNPKSMMTRSKDDCLSFNLAMFPRRTPQSPALWSKSSRSQYQHRTARRTPLSAVLNIATMAAVLPPRILVRLSVDTAVRLIRLLQRDVVASIVVVLRRRRVGGRCSIVVVWLLLLWVGIAVERRVSDGPAGAGAWGIALLTALACGVAAVR